MCGRVILVSWDEMLKVAKGIGADTPREDGACDGASLRSAPVNPSLFEQPDLGLGVDARVAWGNQARPGGVVPALVCPEDKRAPVLARFTWGYLASWNNRLVYNARIESADSGMWASSFASRRALVPVRMFFEPHESETQRNPATGRMGKRQYQFQLDGEEPLLLGAIYEYDRLSIVTTEPNETVAPIHSRMPVVVPSSQAATWLGGAWQALADQSRVPLAAIPEYPDVAPIQPSLFD